MIRHAILATLVVAAATTAAHATSEFEILSAQNVPTLKPGDKLSRGATLSMPATGRISFVDRSGGAVVMRECSGLYSGPIENCTVTSRGQPSAVPGATRGAVR